MHPPQTYRSHNGQQLEFVYVNQLSACSLNSARAVPKKGIRESGFAGGEELETDPVVDTDF
jgi:hypothetical protein